MFGYMYTCSRVLPGAPSPLSPRVLSRGHFSAPLATAVPAHNDTVIVSQGPATRTAQLAGQPSQSRGRCCLGGPRSHRVPPQLPMGPPCLAACGTCPSGSGGGEPLAGCGHLLAWELGNLFFPVVFTRVKRGPLPLHIAFSAWSLPSVSPHNDFFCYINLTHCGEPRRWDPGLLNCVKGKAPAPAFTGSQGCCGVGVLRGGGKGSQGGHRG